MLLKAARFGAFRHGTLSWRRIIRISSATTFSIVSRDFVVELLALIQGSQAGALDG
jgi:hypothetical protein